MTFEELGLSSWLLDALRELGYERPTAIQARTVVPSVAGRDILGVAQTGTGKTGAFCFPVLEYLARGRLRARMPRALILTPTRELATQIDGNIKLYARAKPVRTGLLVGGESMSEQASTLGAGVDVIVATPGRFLDHLQRGRILTSDIRMVVLDEADRMMDMGFIEDVGAILKRLPVDRQTLLFSATMSEDMKGLAQSFLRDPVLVQIDPESPSAETVTQWYVDVVAAAKLKLLLEVVEREEFESLIVFCNRKREIGGIVSYLTRHLRKPVSIAALHGDLSQDVRVETVKKFKSGQINVIVASDVASRGLDVAGMSHVVNFDVPPHGDEYIHRIGRAGRAGRTGVAITFVSKSDARAFKHVLELIKRDVPAYPGLSPKLGTPPEEKAEQPYEGSTQKERRLRARDKKSPAGRVPKGQTDSAALDGSGKAAPNQTAGFGDLGPPKFMRP